MISPSMVDVLNALCTKLPRRKFLVQSCPLDKKITAKSSLHDALFTITSNQTLSASELKRPTQLKHKTSERNRDEIHQLHSVKINEALISLDSYAYADMHQFWIN